MSNNGDGFLRCFSGTQHQLFSHSCQLIPVTYQLGLDEPWVTFWCQRAEGFTLRSCQCCHFSKTHPRRAIKFTLVQNTDYLIFSNLQSPSPMPQTTLLLYLINIPKPHLWRGRFKTCSLISLFGHYMNTHFHHCKTCYLSEWHTTQQAKWAWLSNNIISSMFEIPWWFPVRKKAKIHMFFTAIYKLFCKKTSKQKLLQFLLMTSTIIPSKPAI